jgi:hypothetical protein
MLRRFRLRALRGTVRIPNIGAGNGRRSFVRAGTFLAVVVVAGVVIAAGSAGGTTTKPYTASFDPGPLAGGGTVHVNLAIKNLANPQALGSANVTAASSGSSSFTIVGATASQGDATVASGGVLQLRNLNLAPGGTANVDITVKTPCAGGSYTWSILAKQSNSFNGPPGNDYTLQTAGSNLVTAVAGTCKLVWVTQPANAVVNAVITGTAGDPSGPSVSVQAVDANNVPLTSATGTVTLAKTAGSFNSSGGFTGTQANLVNGVASFSSFKSTAPGSGLMVQASSPGYVSTPLNEGGPFNITSSGVNCVGLDPCLLDANLGGNTSVNAAATGGAFTFLGLNASSVPASVMAPGGGCQYFVTVGAGAFEMIDNRAGPGELRFTYNVPTKLIQKSPNNGQPFIPLCAGAKRLVNNQPVDCNPNAQPGDPDGPWLGKGLNPDGTFNGSLRYAVCGEGGFWWGVMGSFQDPIDPSLNPTITGWGSTTIGNTSYRQFFLRVPNGWDWRVGG